MRATRRAEEESSLRPTKSETERRVAESRRVTGETRRHRKPSRHLAEGGHNQVDDETDDGVRDEDGAGAGLREGLASTDNETCSDGATDSNHSNVTSLKAAVQRRLGRRLDAADVRGRLEIHIGVGHLFLVP